MKDKAKTIVLVIAVIILVAAIYDGYERQEKRHTGAMIEKEFMIKTLKANLDAYMNYYRKNCDLCEKRKAKKNCSSVMSEEP